MKVICSCSAATRTRSLDRLHDARVPRPWGNALFSLSHESVPVFTLRHAESILAEMNTPHWNFESEYQAQGYSKIAGVDEAGRGAWAGPIVAAAVELPLGCELKGLRDSKLMTPPQREVMYERIMEIAVASSVCVIDAETIDSDGIGPCNREALLQAVRGLSSPADAVLVDAFPLDCGVPSRSIIKGDRQSMSIAAASVVAKVTRDRLLIRAEQDFPGYGFAQHKGYGTADHLAALQGQGVSPYHRRSFEPMKTLLKGAR